MNAGLLGVETPEPWLEVSRAVWDNSSWPWQSCYCDCLPWYDLPDGVRGGAVEMGCDIGCTHLWWLMWGGRQLLQVNWNYLSWIRGHFPPTSCWSVGCQGCWSPGGNAYGGLSQCIRYCAGKEVSSISSAMLGLVAKSLGHSVIECGEEIGINNCWGMTFGMSPWVGLRRVTCNQVGSQVASASQIGSLGRGTHSSSKPHLDPLGIPLHHPTEGVGRPPAD